VILGPPREDPVLLTHRPQVLSWDRADTWAQQRLVPYRDEIAARLGPTVASLGAVAFDLSIGFGPTSDLEVVGDLDNYRAPVAEALGRDRIVAAWGSKDTGQSSTLAVGSPRNLAPDALADFQHATVRTRSSTATNAWKAEIASQLSHLMPLPSTGAVELVAGFRVGPGRAWEAREACMKAGASLQLVGTDDMIEAASEAMEFLLGAARGLRATIPPEAQ
jgi:hypothetical protein